MKRNAIALAAGSLFALPVAAADTNSLEIKLSGQVNRAVLQVKDGINSDLFNVDNDNSGTRFRFTGTQTISPGTKAGVVFEVEYQSSPSNLVTFADRTAPSPTLDERHMNVFYQSNWGQVSLGQGDGAANGGVEVDLSGTSVAHYAGVTDIGGAFAFRTAAGGFGPSISQTTSQQDFESRYDRVRYDSPSFNGFGLAASVGSKDTDRDVNEVALRYAGGGGFGQFAAALGYSNEDPATPGGRDDITTGASASWLHPAGYNVTFATSSRDITAARKGKFNYMKLGYKWGDHALSTDFAVAKDENAAGDEAKVFGVAYVYKAAKWAELYALAKNHSLDRPGSTFEDIRVVMAGTRLKF
jgi:predicted porin